MTPAQLIAAALAQREILVPLRDGKFVKIRRPPETAIAGMLRRESDGLQIHAGLAEVKAHAVDWQGFTEADFTPAGSSDAVAFDAALWALWIEDRRDLVAPVAQAIVDAILAHEQKATEAAKN